MQGESKKKSMKYKNFQSRKNHKICTSYLVISKFRLTSESLKPRSVSEDPYRVTAIPKKFKQFCNNFLKTYSHFRACQTECPG